jgi:hypothetical protein
MEFLVLTPPVVTPAEPPSGAFLLAAGLKGWGREAALLDLSLEFFYDLFSGAGNAEKGALDYLCRGASGYTPMTHRSQTGHLHGLVSRFDSRHPGWKLTLMDIAPPDRIHHPGRLADYFLKTEGPFRHLYRRVLEPALSMIKPQKVLVSVAYLSQLAAAIDLVRFLESRGIEPLVGGSLINSLATTGRGFEAVRAVLPRILVGDGGSLIPQIQGRPLLSKLSFPTLLSDKTYLSRRPIIPLALSSGCFWNRCLFCPDRGIPYYPISDEAIEQFVTSLPDEVRSAGVVLHMLDSAIPPGRLRRYLEVVKGGELGFFGFARPTRQLLGKGLISAAADGGCLMLQLGVEGGSRPLLDRFQKGIDPKESEAVVRAAAESGIRTYLYLLFGLPGESAADLDATYKFVVRNGQYIDFLNLSLFNLPRYCELMERKDAFDIQILDFPGDREGIRLYRPFTSGGVDQRGQARKFLKRFRSDPVVREACLRTPRWFRAAHLALMAISGRR